MPGTRSRGGCWSCRQKRRKCDETKPFCNTCKARGAVCGGYEMRLMEFRAQGNYDGQLICKLARGSAPQNALTRLTRRRARGIKPAEETSGTKEPSSQNSPTRLHETSIVAPDSSSTGAAPPIQSQQNVCSPPAEPRVGTEQETLPDRPPAAINPTPKSLQDTEKGLGGPGDRQSCRRQSSTIESQSSFASSLVAATYSSSVSQGEQGIRRASAGDQEHQGQDWDVPSILNYAGVDPLFSLTSPDDRLWQFIQPDFDPPIATWSLASPQQNVEHIELDDFANDDQRNTEHGVDENMPEFVVDATSELGDVDDLLGSDPETYPHVDTLGDEPMVPLRLGSATTPDFEDDDELGLFTLSTPMRALTSRSEFSSPFDSYLYSHFFSVLAPGFYPVAPNRNPYKLVYGKLASIFPPLRATILGASALHLSGMSQLPPGVVTLYRDASRVSFSNAVKTRNQSDALAATMLLSILVDSIGSGTGRWTSKLRLVRSLLQDKAVTAQSPNSSIIISFLHLHFSWMTAIGRTVKWHDNSLADTDSLEFVEDPLQEHLFARDHAKWFCNLPDYRFLYLLKEATELYRTVLRPSLDNSTIRNLMPDVGDLLYRTKEWQPGPSAASAPYNTFVASVNEIWRQGLLCYVYNDICALPSSDPRMQECVSRGMVALRSLSWLQSIIWPLFMIGVHALDSKARQFLETACNKMSISVNFGTPLTIIKFLRQVWADMDVEGTGKSRWRTIMMNSGAEINLMI